MGGEGGRGVSESVRGACVVAGGLGQASGSILLKKWKAASFHV